MLNEHLNNLYYTPLAAQWPPSMRGVARLLIVMTVAWPRHWPLQRCHWWPGPAAGNPVIVDIVISVVAVITRTTVPLHSVAEWGWTETISAMTLAVMNRDGGITARANNLVRREILSTCGYLFIYLSIYLYLGPVPAAAAEWARGEAADQPGHRQHPPRQHPEQGGGLLPVLVLHQPVIIIIIITGVTQGKVGMHTQYCFNQMSKSELQMIHWVL